MALESEGYYSYKGRKINPLKKVKVYRNLNNGKISIKQGNLVVGHADIIFLKDTSFLVNETNRQRVLSKKQKNVHAFIEGYWVEDVREMKKIDFNKRIWYNPYLTEFFRLLDTQEAIHTASYVYVTSDGEMFCQK